MPNGTDIFGSPLRNLAGRFEAQAESFVPGLDIGPTGGRLNGGSPMVMSKKPRGVQGRFAKDTNGDTIFFFLNSAGQLQQAPFGTKPRSFPGVSFFKIFQGIDGSSTIVEHSKRSRRMDPFNFRAFKRAARRVLAVDRAIRQTVSITNRVKKIKPKVRRRKK